MTRELSAACFAALLLILGFSAYQAEESRKLYAECLRITERLLETKPDRFTTPYCRQ